ncbi:YcaO-like family protein [Actinomadura rugatobispora]|uniref:YcaO-like family protein n=1 Tax=Actinomadura rugatobispora TaxID=1994 RepID=A0ABW1A2Q4_9ACTN|nr:YcaO-like family protein [Actinomadura rugatobispora]
MTEVPSQTRGPRLVRAEVFGHPGGGVVIFTPKGTSYRVKASAEDVIALLEGCDGQRPVHSLPSAAAFGADLHPMLAALCESGVLSMSPPVRDEQDRVRFATPEMNGGMAPLPELVVVGEGECAAMVSAADSLVRSAGFGSVRSLAAPAEIATVESDDTVLLALSDHLDRAFLRDVDRRCRQRSLRWSHFHFERERGWFGPHVDPENGPDAEDLLARRAAAAADPHVLAALDGPPLIGDRYLPPVGELFWMLGAVLTDLGRWVAGLPARGAWHEVELDPVELAVSAHPVLPLPGSSPAASIAALPGAPSDLLVDERTGIIRRVVDVEHHPSIPRTLTTVHARTSDVSRVTPWRNDPVAGGSTFGDRAAAEHAAVGEAVERYCGNVVRHDLVTQASFAELRERGESAVDPRKLVLFSQRMYESPGFPFVPFTADRKVHWVRGRSLTHDVPAWLPASMVYANWHSLSVSEGPFINPVFYSGIAAGSSLDSALDAALYEVVERHVTMVWWLNAHPVPSVRPTPELEALWSDGTGESPMRHWLIQLPNEFSVPVLAGCVEHAADGLLTIGFAARQDAAEAGRKAWAEALTLHDIARDLARPLGAYRAAAEHGMIDASSLKPARADRRYLDDYRGDFRDVTDLMCQVQVHLDPRAHDLIRPWIDMPAETDLAPPGPSDLRGAVEARGYEVFYADITTADVAAAGLRVVRVLVPGLVPNSPAAFPYLGNGVVQRAAVELGWRSDPLSEDELNLVPMPHA